MVAAELKGAIAKDIEKLSGLQAALVILIRSVRHTTDGDSATLEALNASTCPRDESRRVSPTGIDQTPAAEMEYAVPDGEKSIAMPLHGEFPVKRRQDAGGISRVHPLTPGRAQQAEERNCHQGRR